jgi:hypothetical protein
MVTFLGQPVRPILMGLFEKKRSQKRSADLQNLKLRISEERNEI